MPVPKVLGIETEYGISGGPDNDPILASSIIVNAYAQEGRTLTNWDFAGEQPSTDARGIPNFTAFAPIVETHLANTVLTNGARLYVDHAHPEYSSPECRTPLQAVLYDLAGEQVMVRALRVANRVVAPESQIALYKNNSDGKGNSYGTHENYLVERHVEFGALVRALVPHFVSRQIVTGAGKVGAETGDSDMAQPAFQISQRAEFFEEVVGLETTLKRPIINTRDEPHSDAERFRRLHVINGDANMSPVATLVKIGATSLLLGALETFGPDAFPAPPAGPVAAIRLYALDTTLAATVLDTDGQRVSAWDYQDRLWSLAERFINEGDPSLVAQASEVALIMRHWREMLDGVRDDRDSVADRVDWVAKLRVLRGYQERFALPDNDARLRAIDLQYHDVRPERSLAARVGLRSLFTDDEIREAVHNPPADTRAFFRGECVRRYGDAVVAANWDSLVFDVGEGPLQRVPMLDPLRGTAALTLPLLETSPTARDLINALDK